MRESVLVKTYHFIFTNFYSIAFQVIEEITSSDIQQAIFTSEELLHQDSTNQILNSKRQSLNHRLPTNFAENKKTTLDNNEENISMDLSICPQCNMLFVSKEEFLAHSKVKCAKRLTCYTCGQFFTRVQGLANHLVDVRHGEMVCSICGFEGESQKDAEIHIAKHAADMDKPYFCTFCDLRFSTRKRWEKHLPKHSNEAPFVCKDCGKAFKWNHALTAHSVVHAPHKKFLCQECGFSTSHVSTFRFHNRMHTGNLMKCDVKSCTFQVHLKNPTPPFPLIIKIANIISDNKEIQSSTTQIDPFKGKTTSVRNLRPKLQFGQKHATTCATTRYQRYHLQVQGQQLQLQVLALRQVH